MALKRVKWAILRDIADYKAETSVLEPTEEMILEEKAREEIKIEKRLDPRYNYYAPLPPPYEDFKKMSEEDKRIFWRLYTWEETKNYFISTFMGKRLYAPRHSEVVIAFLKRQNIEKISFAELKSYHNSQHLMDSLEGILKEEDKVKVAKNWAQIMRNGFSEFLEGYMEGKKEEIDKGPLDIDLKAIQNSDIYGNVMDRIRKPR